MALTLPFFFAYFPLGIAFGMLAVGIGLSPVATTVMSLCVYGGAVQFLALSVLASGGGALELAVTTFPVAFRNAFYGLSLFEQYRAPLLARSYLIFGLVDSTYFIATRESGRTTKFYLVVTALCHLYWVAGTAVGAAIGGHIPTIPGLSFILPALFTAASVDALLEARSFSPLFIALCGAAIGWLIAPGQLLLVAIVLATAVIGFDVRRKGVANG